MLLGERDFKILHFSGNYIAEYQECLSNEIRGFRCDKFKTVVTWIVTRVTLLNDSLVIRFICKYICPIYNQLFQISRNL